MEFEPAAIVSVAIWPDYCSQCGTELGSRDFEGSTLPWCPECRYLFAKNPVPGVQVILHDGESVLLVAERFAEDTLWNVPGGHAAPGERPEEAAVRELHEETGLEVDTDELSLFDVHHGSFERTDYYMITYTAPRSAAEGTIDASWEVDDAAFWSFEEAIDATDVTRESERRQFRELVA